MGEAGGGGAGQEGEAGGREQQEVEGPQISVTGLGLQRAGTSSAALSPWGFLSPCPGSRKVVKGGLVLRLQPPGYGPGS